MGEQVGRRAQAAVGHKFLAVIVGGVHALTSAIDHGTPGTHRLVRAAVLT